MQIIYHLNSYFYWFVYHAFLQMLIKQVNFDKLAYEIKLKKIIII